MNKNLKTFFIALAIVFGIIIFFSVFTTIREKQEKIEGLSQNNSQLKNNINYLNERKNELKSEKERLEKADRINYNPTYERIKEILYNTDVEESVYDEEDYNCLEYSFDLVHEFRKRGIYSCTTELTFGDGDAHANVAINTSDRGVIFIEPQNDDHNAIIGDMEPGENYCDLADWYCSFNSSWEIEKIKHCFEDY